MPPNRKAGQKRGAAWSDDETRLLLSIWDEKSVEEQLDNPQVNNVGIYKSISDEMKEKNYDKSSDQCKVRMHTLKRAYRNCKGLMKKSGKGRRTCKFFDELDAILGCRPASSPLKVIESMSKREKPATGTISSSDSEDNDTEPPSDKEIEPIIEETDEESDDQNEPKETPNIEKKEGKSTPINEKVQKDKPKRKLEQTPQTSTDKKPKKVRKSKLEVALGSVMEGFGNATDKSEDKFIDLEKNKIQLEKDKLELEKAKLESSERQKREERKHQYDMMKMIMEAMGNRPVQQPTPGPSGSSSTMQSGNQEARQMDQWSADADSPFNRTYYTM